MSSTENKYDVIIIGSGIGGLTTASLLAQLENKRVLILEQHSKPGGFTHTFNRKGKYEWDVGLHYVGQMDVGQPTRAVFDFITSGKVDWSSMPAVFDSYVFPDFTFDVRVGIENFKSDLIAQFPNEQTAIEQYFEDLIKVQTWMDIYGFTQLLPKIFRPFVMLVRKFRAKLALMTTGEYIDQHFRDEKLKAVIVGQWGLYGLPPEVSAFITHTFLTVHYSNGGFYPVGGSAVIAEKIIPVVESYGGHVLVNHTVGEIIIKNNKAVGVRASHKKGREIIENSFYADVIISNAGAHTTYTQMMPKGVRLPFDEKIREFPNGTANVTLYLGLKEDPAKLGLNGENIWIYDGYDHDAMYAKRNDLAAGKVSAAFLSFPSMKNLESRGHTAEIIAFMDAEPFIRWENEPWRKRGEDYDQLKERISDALIGFVEKRLPGFEALIEYRELATPISTKHFTNHRNGNIYGLPSIPEKFKAIWLGPNTPVRNLYLTGSDAWSFGIVGAMMSGVFATAVALRRPWKMMNIMSKAIQFSHQLHSE